MKTIIIRKIPPIDDFKRFVPKRFSRFPQLYLELLENKIKLNKLYWQRICTNNTSSLYRKRNYCVKRSSCSTKFDIKYAYKN